MSLFSNNSARKPPHVATFSKGAKVTARFETSMGTFVCTLFADKCPITVGNFVGLARGETPWSADSSPASSKPLYDGTVFHRVIPDFMIQGGDPKGSGMGGPGYRFDDEIVADLKHDKAGILSMANSGPNTNGSQFFVTDVPTPWLDGRHTVFGEVTEGMDVVRAIARAPADDNNKPNTAIVLKKVTIATA
jgi:peptidyl-prolyl cis-trans isomerase A (cyclophilin A)